MTGRAPPFKCSAVISDGDCELTRSGMRLSCGNWAPSGALFLFGRAMIVADEKFY
jgi:hypothetical protein